MKKHVKRVSPLLIAITVSLALSSIVATSGARQASSSQSIATSGGTGGTTEVFGIQRAHDPGARTDNAGAGLPFASLSSDELAYFQTGYLVSLRSTRSAVRRPTSLEKVSGQRSTPTVVAVVMRSRRSADPARA